MPEMPPKAAMLLAGLLIGLGASGVRARPPRPNIILITVDTFRADHIGYYGYPRPTTPALDAFGREGVFFRQAFTTSGWTTPGLISLLTSLYAPTHGVDIRGRSLAPEVETLPEVLRAAGYRAPDIFFLTDIPNFANLGLTPYAGRGKYLNQGDEILFKWLEEEAGGERPFFLYYHYRDLHLPYHAGEPYESIFMPAEYRGGWSPLGWIKRFVAREKMDAVRTNVMLPRGAFVDFTGRDSTWVEALYDAQVRRLDEELFARLRRALEVRGLARNTLVVVAADHGEELLDHGLIGHVSTFKEGRLYDEILRIPLLLWWPQHLPAGRVVEEPVQCIDLMPTLLELLDIPAPAPMQGQSLLPLIEARPGWRRRPVYAETSGGGYTADQTQYAQRFRALRTERWKLFYAGPTNEYALYDLQRDPGERKNVEAAYPQVADSLKALLNTWALATRRPLYHPAKAPEGVPLPDLAAAGAPAILFPQNGDTLHYQGVHYSIQPRWSGVPGATYRVEYEVGRGAYHLEGSMSVSGSAPSYGPFQPGFWNSLVLYNPWRFRVSFAERPQEKSAWVAFYLAPTGGREGGFSLAAGLWQLGGGLRAGWEVGGHLLWGLGRGLVDLYLWAARAPAADLSAYALLLAIAGAALWPWARRWGAERSRAWGLAGLYIALVYSTIPFMPRVWRRLGVYTQDAIGYSGIVAVVLMGLVLIFRMKRRRRRKWTWAALGGLAAIYGYLLQVYGVYPAERLHLLEYGFMGYALFAALSLDLSERRAYIASFVLTVLVGLGDEVIQWVLPQRVFEVKDVQLNALSAALGLLLLRVLRAGGEGGEGE